MNQSSNGMLCCVRGADGAPHLERRPIPVLKGPRDAIVRVTRAAICTSDLHILRGAVPRAGSGIILGHEFAGVVEAVGEGVSGLAPGDRVAANCESFCGQCWFCRRGWVNNCLHGGWMLGCVIDGCQAEYVRVPFADTALTRLPDGVTEEDALFVGDVLASGYWSAGLCEIRPGDTVAVLGAGPVGLCAAMCAHHLGAGRVIVAEPDASRRALCLREKLADAAVPPEELCGAVHAFTEGRGADSVIEAAGANDSFQLAWQAARPNAVVAVAAMYEEDQTLPLPRMYGKNLVFKTGGVDASQCGLLVDLIARCRLRTDFLITHRAPLSRIEEGYRVFGSHQDGCIKWVVTAD